MSQPPAGVVATSVLPVDRLRSQLSDRGWTVAVVTGGTSRDAALSGIASALRFPAHFGGNLDALWDCLTDLTEPTALVWSGWEALAVHEPGDWAALLEVLRTRAVRTEGPAFAVVFVATATPRSA